MRLSVIIVNYNVKYFLEQCLHSVKKACKNIDAEIIVVDNYSTDGSKDYLTGLFTGINFIWLQTNTGFAKANNIGVANAKGDFILYLNPDTILPEDCLEKCLHFFDEHLQAGGLGIKMIDGSGKFLKESKRAFPSPLISLFKLTGLTKLFPKSKLFARYHLGHLPNNKNQQIDVLAGAFMMVPKKVLNQVGYFDERFFMYGEDVDLSYRIQKAGYKNYYFAESTIIHFKGESTKRGSLNYVRMFYKAMSLFVKKHYNGTKAGIFIFFIQTAIFIRAIFSAIGNLLKKMGLPVLDAVIIFSSFWITKILWSAYIAGAQNYSPNVILIAFPSFTALFLLAAYYAGLYDKGYKQSQLIRSTIIAGLVLLSFFGLLPDTLRFSRGILIVGIVVSFLFMNLIRQLFIYLHYLETSPLDENRRQTIVVAGEEDFNEIVLLMQKAGMPDKVLGRISLYNTSDKNVFGQISELKQLIKRYGISEIIFCENGVSFLEIINQVSLLPNNIHCKFHASGSQSIIGSQSSNVSGNYVAIGTNYKIANPVQRRNKRLLDVLLAIIFYIGLPFFLLFKKNVARFYVNTFAVLTAKKTWVGYATQVNKLPNLKKSVLSSTALPVELNELTYDTLLKNDEWYAQEYSVINELKIIYRGFKYL